MTETESEKQVFLPLRNPNTGKSSTIFKYAGKIDLIEERQVIIDWKSAADVNSFRDRKAVGFQAECYALALKRLGYNVTEYQYRVIQTPGIKLSAVDRKAALERMVEEFGYPICEHYKDGANGGEDAMWAIQCRYVAQAYEQRCYDWIMERPGERITTITHPITQSALDQAMEWLWAVKERLQLARRTGSYLTNEAACGAYGARCPYVELCGGAKDGADLPDIVDRRFAAKLSHSELNLPDGVKPENIITYSSAAKFSLCEQRYYWSSVLNLRPKGEETSKSLFIGSAMHEGLEFLPKHGLAFALEKIGAWLEANPVVGAEATERQDQDAAKARAMVRAAATYWRYE